MTFHPDVVTSGFLILPDVPEVYGANFITFGMTNSSSEFQILTAATLVVSPDGLRLLDGQSGVGAVAFVARFDPISEPETLYLTVMGMLALIGITLRARQS